MTPTTDKRQLRMTVEGILSTYGVDNLQLSIDLCEGFLRLVNSDSPVRTRDEILAGVRKAMNKGAGEQVRFDVIRSEIRTRIHIEPLGDEWEDFIKWADKKEQENGEKIERFLNWWTADEWRLAHPPFNPRNWYIAWPQAFPTVVSSTTTGSSTGYYA